ncbi:MAG TPA: RIP metalloprotease RseP [Terriglobales bacterium]|nr:RIP metalloprotease RseP [Terriglobales bacterium]
MSVAFVLGIMIIVHEFGHFAAAKLFGVRVETFSVGFGKRLFGFRRGDTDYRLSLIPLGGYVKMSGENILEQRTGADYEFMSHPRWQRFVIAAAGPFMNIMLAVALLTAVYMIRYEHPVYLDRPAVIGWVLPGSPADKAGIQAGDRIVHVAGLTNPVWEDVEIKTDFNVNQPMQIQIDRNGQLLTKTVTPAASGPEQIGDPGWVPDQPNTVTEIEPNMPAANSGLKVGDNITDVNGQPTRSTAAMIRILQDNKEKPATLTVLRDGKTLEVTVTPKLMKGEAGQPDAYRIGIHSNPIHVDKLSFTKALQRSIEQNKKYSLLVFDLVGKMFKNHALIKQVSGPIEIARASGAAAQQPGWTPLLALMAAISLNLGIFNLFPFPILDGGMILMLAIEGLRRRDISLTVKERVYQVAFVLLVVFAVLVIFNDISKLPAFNHLP